MAAVRAAGTIFPSPSTVETQRPQRVLVAGNTMAGAEQQAEMFIEVERTAEIERGEAFVVVG